LSPILDMYDSSIISYDISTSPSLEQTKRMLNDHLQHQLPVANKKIAPVFFEEYIAEQFAELLK